MYTCFQHKKWRKKRSHSSSLKSNLSIWDTLYMYYVAMKHWNSLLTINDYGLIWPISKSNMKYSSVFSKIDFFSIEHGITSCFNIARLGQVDQKLKSLLRDSIFWIVNKDISILGSFQDLAEIRKNIVGINMFFFLIWNLFMHDLTHICKASLNFYDRINKDR